MKDYSILLIDGDESWRAQIASALEKAGFHVSNVPDGYQGLSSLQESGHDIVVMTQDIAVPSTEQMFSLMRKISYLPIIVLGNSPSEKREREILEAGADAYISRSHGPAELVARVHSLLRRKQAGFEIAAKKSSLIETEPSPTVRQVDETP